MHVAILTFAQYSLKDAENERLEHLSMSAVLFLGLNLGVQQPSRAWPQELLLCGLAYRYLQ